MHAAVVTSARPMCNKHACMYHAQTKPRWTTASRSRVYLTSESNVDGPSSAALKGLITMPPPHHPSNLQIAVDVATWAVPTFPAEGCHCIAPRARQLHKKVPQPQFCRLVTPAPPSHFFVCSRLALLRKLPLQQGRHARAITTFLAGITLR